MLGDFYSQGVAQLGLFDEYKPRSNSEQLIAVLDGINQSGKGRVWFAGQGIQKSWEMKRQMLSPTYTTRFSDLMRVKVKTPRSFLYFHTGLLLQLIIKKMPNMIITHSLESV